MRVIEANVNTSIKDFTGPLAVSKTKRNGVKCSDHNQKP